MEKKLKMYSVHIKDKYKVFPVDGKMTKTPVVFEVAPDKLINVHSSVTMQGINDFEITPIYEN